jgi:hypothetical protein
VAGLSPEVLHQVLLESKPLSDPKGKGRAVDGADASSSSWVPVATSEDATAGFPRVVYEINTNSEKFEPRLRMLVNTPLSLPTVPADGDEDGQAARQSQEHEFGNAIPPYQQANFTAPESINSKAQSEDYRKEGFGEESTQSESIIPPSCVQFLYVSDAVPK